MVHLGRLLRLVAGPSRAHCRRRTTSYVRGPTIVYERPLPKLPIPSLAQTLERYLRTVRPVVDAAQYARTQALVEEFGGPTGAGQRLQRRLEQYADTKENWVYEMWLDDMYLKARLPLPLNSNPGMIFPRLSFEDRSDQLRFSARLISGILDYKYILDTKTLPVDRCRSREKGQPLCMDQYYRLFTTYRVPGIPKDRQVSALYTGEPDPEHIVVACRNQFFSVDVFVNGNRLSDDNIYAQLKRVLSLAEDGVDSAERVGILTALPRDRWALTRDKLLQNKDNAESLGALEKSIFIICLDKAMPLSFNHQTSIDENRCSRDDVSLAKQMLHGQGSEHNTCNRWFDKTMQFVIGEDGASGICYEHSPAEGIAVVQLIEHLLKYMEEIRQRRLPRMQSLCELQPPRRLEWRLTASVQDDIHEAATLTDRMIANLDLYVLRFNDFGNIFPKQNNMSPDAFMQLALQLTYYKVHQRLVPTYESASIRRFRMGRVDNIRACTQETLEFAQAMVGETPATDEEKMALLRRAINRQTEILVQVILGHGIDNHLLGLREMAVLEGLPTPELFRDTAYTMSNHFTLSTSQVPTSMDFQTCYGPVVPDGYGACYNLQPDYIEVCVSSFISCGETYSDNFAFNLESCLLQMRDLCEKVKSDDGKTTVAKQRQATVTKQVQATNGKPLSNGVNNNNSTEGATN